MAQEQPKSHTTAKIVAAALVFIVVIGLVSRQGAAYDPRQGYEVAVAKVKSRTPGVSNLDAKLIAVGDTPHKDCGLFKPTQAEIQDYAKRTSIPLDRVPGFLSESCAKMHSSPSPEVKAENRRDKDEAATLRTAAYCIKHGLDCD